MLSPIDGRYADIISQCLDNPPVRTRNSNCHRSFSVPEVRITATPLLLARKVAWKNCLREWEWFMSGSNNIHDLHESVRPWWQPWANADGTVWANYGQQFRMYGCGFDQIRHLIDGIKEHPYSRRNIITTWHTEDMADPATPITNCHGTVIQAFVEPDQTLYLKTYQRSCDVICGLPHNWFQYWAFLLWLAHQTNHHPGSLLWTGGDVHVYEAHVDLARKILTASQGQLAPAGPVLTYTPSSDTFKADDFTLIGDYNPVLTDRAEMIV